MEIWVYAVLVLIALAAPRYGADSRWSRPGEAPRRRATVRGDLTRLRHVLQSQVPRAKTASVCPPSSRCSAL
ncbi:hypothetical protein GCM10010210_23010 [Pseudonocardia hydrocarbonoxydans]|uniref:Uncharacterized protein n=1 Tax=Pseudonocardia hydrocarbonoxydans TaxID=76726 RepID=A0A4Y3WR71_9PSEU|nr:hypothetical protein PHY01_25820 [Pseudonocardia hydrocarbonoxydans]